MAKTKILYVEQNVDGTIGGSHRSLLSLVERLVGDDYACEAVFYESHSLWSDFSRHSPMILLEKPKRLKSRRSVSLIRKAANYVLMRKDIRRFMDLLKDRRPDIVHLNNSFCVGYDTWGPACKAMRIPLLTHERSWFSKGLVRRAVKHIGAFYKVICVSEAVKNHYVSLGVPEERLAVVHNGIDIVSFNARVTESPLVIRERYGISREQPLVGMVGNMRRWKGQHVLVNAIDRVRQKIADLRCLIIGSVGHEDKQYLTSIMQMIREKGLTNNITITGYRDDIPAILATLDVQVHTSISGDPFPRVILEGMGLGLPIVCSRSGGAVESVQDGVTGFLCTPGDDEEMAQYIIRLLQDVGLRKRMGEAAKLRVSQFTMERHVAEVKRHYCEILAAASSSKGQS